MFGEVNSLPNKTYVRSRLRCPSHKTGIRFLVSPKAWATLVCLPMPTASCGTHIHTLLFFPQCVNEKTPEVTYKTRDHGTYNWCPQGVTSMPQLYFSIRCEQGVAQRLERPGSSDAGLGQCLLRARRHHQRLDFRGCIEHGGHDPGQARVLPCQRRFWP